MHVCNTLTQGHHPHACGPAKSEQVVSDTGKAKEGEEGQSRTTSADQTETETAKTPNTTNKPKASKTKDNGSQTETAPGIATVAFRGR